MFPKEHCPGPVHPHFQDRIVLAMTPPPKPDVGEEGSESEEPIIPMCQQPVFPALAAFILLVSLNLYGGAWPQCSMLCREKDSSSIQGC